MELYLKKRSFDCANRIVCRERELQNQAEKFKFQTEARLIDLEQKLRVTEEEVATLGERLFQARQTTEQLEQELGIKVNETNEIADTISKDTLKLQNLTKSIHTHKENKLAVESGLRDICAAQLEISRRKLNPATLFGSLGFPRNR